MLALKAAWFRSAPDCPQRGPGPRHLHAGQEPGNFPKERLRLDFSEVPMSPRLRLLMEGLLEPLAEERLTADQALAVLRSETPAPARGAAAEAAGARCAGESGAHGFVHDSSD